MDAPSLSSAADDVAQRIADTLADTGWPRMAGRVVGLLLVADPPYLSSAELCERLPASKAHVSGVMQLLTSVGLVQRFGVPGSRRDHYRLSTDAWVTTTRRSFAVIDQLAAAAELASDLAPSGSAAKEQADHMRDFYVFLAERLPALITEFEETR